MKKTLIALALVCIASGFVWAQTPVSVTPSDVKAGGQATLHGNDLGIKSVKAVYISDANNDYKVSIVSQGDNAIVFVVPFVKIGDYGISLFPMDGNKLLWHPEVKFHVLAP